MADILGGSQQVDGETPHDAPDAGNPHKVGYHAIPHGANPVAVQPGDRTQAYANRHGVPWVIGGHPNVLSREVVTNDAQTNAVLIAGVPGSRIVVTKLMVSNGSNGRETCRVGFGAAAIPPPSLAGANGILLNHRFNRSTTVVQGSGSGILAVGGISEDLRFSCSNPNGEGIVLIASYYTVES